MPQLIVLAGPNGAGKTTFARRIFAAEIAAGHFINADDVARSLNGESVEDAAVAAARSVLARRRERLVHGRDMIIETTLSGHGLLRELRDASRRGFVTLLHYLFLPDPDTCVQRVANRIQNGGHAIPTDTIHRRYWRGLALLPDYLAAVDRAWIWAAAGEPRLIATKSAGTVTVFDPGSWSQLNALAQPGGGGAASPSA